MSETKPVIPLNGVKTHPLSPHAIEVLRTLARGLKPSQEINPGVINRLLRGNLIELVQSVSPYTAHKGRPIEHAAITELGSDLVNVRNSKPSVKCHEKG